AAIDLVLVVAYVHAAKLEDVSALGPGDVVGELILVYLRVGGDAPECERGIRADRDPREGIVGGLEGCRETAQTASGAGERIGVDREPLHAIKAPGEERLHDHARTESAGDVGCEGAIGPRPLDGGCDEVAGGRAEAAVLLGAAVVGEADVDPGAV